MDNLAVALKLAARGWHVFPCGATKRPLTEHGFYEATTDADVIATWFSFDFPEALVGVWAGASGIVCLDLDVKDGKDGVAAIAAASLQWETPMTYLTISGTGRHAIFIDPDVERSTPAVNYRGMQGVDIRAGNSYFIFTGDDPDAALAPCPTWLRDAPPERDAAEPFEATAGEWLAQCTQGPTEQAAERVLGNLPPVGEIGHDAMRDALRALVGFGVDGMAGVPDAIERLRSRYLDGEYDTPKWRKDFDAALTGAIAKFGGFPPSNGAASEAFDLYVDVGAILSGDLTSPKPSIAQRTDGAHLIYARAVNVLFGAPESGKTLIATAVAADMIFNAGGVLWVDLDHNGAAATINRLRSFGVLGSALRDRDVFRLAEPESPTELEAIINEVEFWEPALVVVDSVGELLGLHSASNDSADDFTRVNRQTLAKLGKRAAVIAIDHEAKGTDSRAYGAGGTMAKKRAVDGSYLRVNVLKPFAPGKGGKAKLSIVKDRHGGVRALSPAEDREPEAATFELLPIESATHWKFHAPTVANFTTPAMSDLDVVLGLSPAPTSANNVRKRTGWGTSRAKRAWDSWLHSVGNSNVSPLHKDAA